MERQRTDEELKQVAKDLYAGRIFTDRQIPKGQDPSMVFMVLVFMDEEQRKQFKKGMQDGTIYMLYEYMEKAGPRSINGMPQFMSHTVMNKPDTEKMIEYYNKVKEALDNI